MNDPFGRPIDYLRVSVTDRCNLRCWYCAPTRNWNLLRHEELLSFDEITAVVRSAAALGFRKFRITGGEPLCAPACPAWCNGSRQSPASRISGSRRTASCSRRWRSRYARRDSTGSTSRSTPLIPARFAAITEAVTWRRSSRGSRPPSTRICGRVKLNCVVERDLMNPTPARWPPGRQHMAARRGSSRTWTWNGESSRRVFGGAGGDSPCLQPATALLGRVASPPASFQEPAFNVRELGPDEALRRAIDAKPEAGGRCSSRNWMHGIGG